MNRSNRDGLIVLMCLLLPAVQARADPTYPEVWINPGLYSFHFDRSENLRDNNIGFGAELTLTRDHALAAGTFINSDDERTHYAAWQWRPLHTKLGSADVAAGLVVAALNGYSRVRDGGWFVAPLPQFTIQGDRVGFNFIAVPEIRNHLHGALAVQFKLRIW